MTQALRCLFLLCLLGFLLFLYIQEQNDILTLRRRIPALEKEVREIQEENLELRYLSKKALSPQHLLELQRDPTYGHLHYPKNGEVIYIHP